MEGDRLPRMVAALVSDNMYDLWNVFGLDRLSLTAEAAYCLGLNFSCISRPHIASLFYFNFQPSTLYGYNKKSGMTALK